MTIRIPDPKANTTTEAYLAYKAGYLEESELKPSLYEPYLHFDAWLAYWAGLTDTYPVLSKNKFNIETLAKGGIVVENGVATGTAGQFYTRFHNGITLAKTSYVMSITVTAYKDGEASSGNGISFRAFYTDGTEESIMLFLNSTTTATTLTGSTDSSKRLSYIGIVYGSGSSNVWHLSDIQIEEGTVPTEYEPYDTPEMLCDEEALVAYLAGVTDTYPKDIKDPYDVRIVGYLKHLASVRWPEPDYPVNNEEFYLSTMEPTHTSNSEPSANIELDTAEGKIISVEAYGDTYQHTYTGKNLIDYLASNYANNGAAATISSNSVTFTKDTDGAYRYSIFKLTAEQTAKILGKEVTVSCNKASSIPNVLSGIRMYWVKENNNVPGNLIYDGRTTESGDAEFSVTLPAVPPDNEYPLISLLFYPDVDHDAVANSATLTVSNLQLEIGTATAYEPYVGGIPAPNPDYPQPVNVVTGRQTVTITGENSQSSDYEINLGKNLFSGNYSQFDNTGGTGTLYNYFKLPESGDYTLTIIAKNDIGAQSPQKFIGFTAQGGDATGGYVWAFSGSATMQKGDVRSIRNTYQGNRLGYLSMYPNNETTLQWFVENFDIQLEVGGTSTSYAPYFEPIELCKIGNYQDYIYKDGDDWYVHKATEKVVYNGTENWEARTGKEHTFQIVAPTIVNGGFCNYFTPIKLATGFDQVNGIYLSNTGAVIVSYLVISSVEDFKTWLSTHNLIVYYGRLNTSTETKITNDALIGQLEALADADTYDEKTYIRVAATDPNLPALLKVEAYKY